MKGWLYRNDIPFLVEGHFVKAHFAMCSWHSATVLLIYKVFVDAVVANVPFIFAGYLQNGVVRCTINLILWHLLYHAIVLLVYLDVAQWRGACTIANMIVWRACIIY